MHSFGTRTLAVALLVVAPVFAAAQVFTLTDGGATVDVNSASGTVTNFFLGGVDHAAQQTYYLRNGDAGTAAGLGTFALISSSQPLANFLELVYGNGTFNIQIRYLLTGAGQQADLAESVVVWNMTGQTTALRLFQYTDWDLAGTAGFDTVTRQNSSTMGQVDNVVFGNSAVTGGTPIPEFSELGAFPLVRNKITGTAGYFLDTPAGGGIGQQFTGDATFAFQWNRNLAPEESFALSTNKVVAVPEPGSMIALGLGAAALLARRRRKKAA